MRVACHVIRFYSVMRRKLTEGARPPRAAGGGTAARRLLSRDQIRANTCCSLAVKANSLSNPNKEMHPLAHPSILRRAVPKPIRAGGQTRPAR